MKCQWRTCTNEATKAISRMVTPEEQKASRRNTDAGTSFAGLAVIHVCDTCLPEARKKYPDMVNL